MKILGLETPRRVALKDISDYLTENRLNIVDGYGDIWTVTPNHLDKNKEVTILNKKLGIHKANKFGKRMARH